MKRGHSWFVMLAILMVIISTGCSSKTGEKLDRNSEVTIRMGLSPQEDSAEILRQYEAFKEHMEEKTGYKFDLFVGADYTTVVEAINSGKLDVAWFGPTEYLLAKEITEVDIEAFAQATQEEAASPYQSWVIVNSKSDIKTVEDLKGKNFAFTDPASTSGNIFGYYQLIQEGLDPKKDFANVTYSGSHDASALSVANGTLDGATVSSRLLEGFYESGLVNEKDIRVIAKSMEIPNDLMAYHSDLSEDVKEKLRDAINDTEGITKALAGTGYGAFKEVNDSDYDIVREAFKIAGVEPSFE
ncbi:phosphate/phosphite/phosphonate ABC transporter substrate-binding protein [Pseudobacillus badius]|uniref:phosphate/phosphite/phosphonate ABC transporter substrate-binding protein n=1 Tax=Bacillus badius TaxID=1455 RepID=UPI001CBEB29F|nr:phosphate/phosphite/phosphonate ABC transporter substrate-binding protein [Bacillus badius]UAT32420.1 phosphate/phosphite/phosphonate ABC transporter substrate-binding protein [Bacillus badius]